MGRPKIEDKVRKAVQHYLLTAETLSPQEAPLNVVAVSKRLGFNRKTLVRYGLDSIIRDASDRQARNGKLSPREIERRSYADMVRDRDNEIAAMRRRCEELIGRICLAEGNAQRLGLDPEQLWEPLRAPDRSVPHSYRTNRRSRA